MPSTFINITITNPAAHDPELAQKLADVCPVDIFTATPNGPHINEHHLDECVLCELCINATPPGTITIHKLYQEVPA